MHSHSSFKNVAIPLLVACCVLAAVPAFAQSPIHREYLIKKQELLDAVTGADRSNAAAIAVALDVRGHATFYLLYLAQRFSPEWKPDETDPAEILEAARTDKQVGTSTNSNGNTSLVSKGSVPAIIGFAVENGTLTQMTSGTTITVRGNPWGIYTALRGQLEALLPVFTTQSGPSTALRRFSFAVSFDASRGNEGDEAVFRGNAEQLSSVSGRYEFINNRAPWTKAYQGRFRQAYHHRKNSYCTHGLITGDWCGQQSGRLCS